MFTIYKCTVKKIIILHCKWVFLSIGALQGERGDDAFAGTF
jgi:hypothetical protein